MSQSRENQSKVRILAFSCVSFSVSGTWRIDYGSHAFVQLLSSCKMTRQDRLKNRQIHLVMWCFYSATPKRKPMPKLVYHLMSDKELKKRVTEAGLSTQGDRKVGGKGLRSYRVGKIFSVDRLTFQLNQPHQHCKLTFSRLSASILK